MSSSDDGQAAITVDPTRRVQRVDGWGANVTEASVISLLKMPQDRQREVMRMLFDKKTGAGLSYLRMPLGASDFVDREAGFYTYNDTPDNQPDPEFKHFSLARDMKSIEFILEAQRLNPSLKVMLTPWSAPAWMKRGNNGIFHGTVAEEHLGDYARYLAKTIREFQKLGVNVDSLSINNEPYFTNNVWYIGMEMSTEQQADFIARFLGPELRRQGLRVKVLALDHNYELYNEALNIANHPEAKRFIDGIAFHCYGGVPAQMQNVRNVNHRIPLYQTECTTLADGSYWKRSFDQSLNDFVLQPGVRVDLAWNILLPPLEKRPSSFREVCPECTGLLEIHPEGEIVLTADYWVRAQVSRYVDAGAFEVESQAPVEFGVTTRAFLNPDGSRVLLVNNQHEVTKQIKIHDTSAGVIDLKIQPRSALTIKWGMRN